MKREPSDSPSNQSDSDEEAVCRRTWNPRASRGNSQADQTWRRNLTERDQGEGSWAEDLHGAQNIRRTQAWRGASLSSLGTPRGQSTAANTRQNREREHQNREREQQFPREQQDYSRAPGQSTMNTSRSNKTKLFKVSPFPEGTAPTAQLEQWRYWLDNFEMSAERAEERDGELSQREKAVELTLHIGDEMRRIISAKQMLADRRRAPMDFPFYDDLVNRLYEHFESLTDESVDVTLFDNIKQSEDETIMQFDLRLRLLAKRIRITNAPIIRERLLRGMRDTDLAKRAHEDGIAHEQVVKTASRREAATKCGAGSFPWPLLKPPTAIIAAVDKTQTNRDLPGPSGQREEAQAWRSQERIQFHPRTSAGIRAQNNQRSERIVKPPRGVRPGECKNCGIRHEGRACPAIEKACNACGKTGHFWYVCRSSGVQQQQQSAKRIRSLYEDGEERAEVRE